MEVFKTKLYNGNLHHNVFMSLCLACIKLSHISNNIKFNHFDTPGSSFGRKNDQKLIIFIQSVLILTHFLGKNNSQSELEDQIKYDINIWRPPSLSKLTPYQILLELTHCGSESSVHINLYEDFYKRIDKIS